MAVGLEQFVKSLEDSGIITPSKLKAVREKLPSEKQQDAQELARELVRLQKLTKFQAQEAYQGKAKNLVLGNYVILDKIGAGGMGQVYKAEHRRMHRTVAIKMLPSSMTKDAAAIARFEREVTAAAKLRHTNIVAADDADQARGIHFLVMEYVEGSDLSALVKKNGPFPLDKAVNYTLQAARGLEYAHGEGVVHRDIKPANLLLDKKGTIKILDMGLARLETGIGGEVGTAAELTTSGQIMGTVDYMSPEQAFNTKQADARADIYSLGCTLFYLLTGQPLYGGETIMEKLLAHREKPIPALRDAGADVPAEVDAIYQRMVAKKVEDRYQSMTEVIADLQACGVGGGSTVTGKTQSTTDAASSNSNLTFLKDAAAGQTIQRKTTKPSKQPAATGSRGSSTKRFALIGGGVLLALLLAAGIVVSLRTKEGTLIVEVDQPDAVVQVLDAEGKVEVSEPGGAGKVTISVVPGKHRLKVEKDGFAVFGQEFEMEKGGKKEIAAKLLPPEVVKPANDLALEFDGKTSYVQLPWNYQGDHPLTLEAWAQIRNDGELMSDAESAGMSFGASNGRLRVAMSTTNKGYQRATDPRPVRFENYKHVAAVVEPGKELRLYVDGQAIHSTPFLLPYHASALPLLIGANPAPGGGRQALLIGTINEVRISKVARYTGNFTPEPRFTPDANTIALYHFDEGNGDTALDASDNKHHAKVVGARWVRAVSSDPPTGPTPSPPLANSTIDLLALMAPAQDAISGTWERKEAGLRGTIAADFAVIEAPYRVPEEYDLTVEFTRQNVQGQVALALTHADKQFKWVLGLGTTADRFGFDAIDKKYVQHFPEARHPELTLVDGRRYVTKVEVRRDRLSGYLDGKLVTELKTDYSNLTTPERAKMRDSSLVGLIVGTGTATFHRAELTDVTGHGARTRAGLPGGAQPTSPAGAAAELFMHEPTFAQWLATVQAMPAAEQVKAVSAKLVELNPGYDGKVTGGTGKSEPSIVSGVVTEFGLIAEHVTDLSPARAFEGLKVLRCWRGSQINPLSDLSPLRGMALTSLTVHYSKVRDLSPLRGMPLTTLDIYATDVSDLLPLAGMKLTFLTCSGAVTDLSPLAGMPLRNLAFNHAKVSDLSPLRGMPLELLDCLNAPISDLSPLRNMPLTAFVCVGSNVADLSPLATCKNLKLLNVKVTKVTSAEIAALQKALPDCKIDWDDPAKATAPQRANPTGPAPPPAKAPFNADEANKHQAAWAKHLGIEIATPNSVGQKMVLIPPGEFMMGSTDEQVGEAMKLAEEIKTDQPTKDRTWKNERPQHQVVITKPLLMSATEVTIGEFKKFAAAARYLTEAEVAGTVAGQPLPKHIQTYANPGYDASNDLPAAFVSWNDAVAYCKWLSDEEKTTYRLPTEAEWEYACRAGTTAQFSFGDDYNELPTYCWHKKNSGGKTHPVGTLRPNSFGLFDMHGNLQEWCHDFYGDRWFEESSSNDPRGPSTGTARIIRGGGWANDASSCRSAFRNQITATHRAVHNGFRVVRELTAR